jgi:hypothetical protein
VWALLAVVGASSRRRASDPTPPPAPPPGFPCWTATPPNASAPLGGFTQLRGVENTEVCHATLAPGMGQYNHAVMLGYHDGVLLTAWKNGATTEDKNGQRILYSQSRDGLSWTSVDGGTQNELFPNMTTPGKVAALFVGPPIVLNGRQYVGASPGVPTGAAQGAQFCLWPDPLSDGTEGRNCGPPGHSQDGSSLLMRRVLPGIGNLGPIFWAAEQVPADWAAASKALGIGALPAQDAQTVADVRPLSPREAFTPCADPATSGTLKCEACTGGCALWDAIPKATQPLIGNERSHYLKPGSGDGVILYRSGANGVLYAALRSANASAEQAAWGAPLATNISNDESNLNTGPLPDGRIYLVHNAVFRAKAAAATGPSAAGASQRPAGAGAGLGTLRFRDPITLATSADGVTFDKAHSLASCTNLSATSTCAPRYQPSPGVSGGKNPGPSYPQGMAVVAPAPAALRGFYVAFSNNKEDIWVSRVPFDKF